MLRIRSFWRGKHASNKNVTYTCLLYECTVRIKGLRIDHKGLIFFVYIYNVNPDFKVFLYKILINLEINSIPTRSPKTLHWSKS